MPFTDDFNKVRRKFQRLYSDKARAETFAFEEAFKLNMSTFQKRRQKFKKQNKDFIEL